MAGPKTDSDGRIRTSNNGAPPARKTLAQQIDSPEFMQALRSALPKHITPEKMARIALTALRTTRGLAACSPESFFASLLQAALLGLEVNTPNGHAYLVPYKDQCQLIVGYQGMIELALRSGKVSKIWTRTVREGDEFRVQYGLDETIVHVPATDPKREERPITYVYAVAKLTTGDVIFEPLSIAQVEARKKRSAASRSGPWVTDTEAMIRKTAVRSLFKWVPKSSEMALAESLEERADEGRSQLFDGMVHQAMDTLGMQPIDTVAEEAPPHDPETGEVPNFDGSQKPD